jgi:hypothetical protein
MEKIKIIIIASKEQITAKKSIANTDKKTAKKEK